MLALSLAVIACDKTNPPVGATSASASASAPPVASPTRPPPAAASSAPAGPVPFEVQRFVLTSDVKHKNPVDELTVVEHGERVYAHLTVRNRGEDKRPVRFVFRVNGDERANVPLTIAHSWQFRTWAYVTLRDGDRKGKLTVTVLEGDTEVTRAEAPIGGK